MKLAEEIVMAAEAIDTRFDDPTAANLGLPSDEHELYAMQALCTAPRAAWRAYWAATGQLTGEAADRDKARAARRAMGDRPKRFGRRRKL